MWQLECREGNTKGPGCSATNVSAKLTCHISSIRHRGYYFFLLNVSVLLFEGGVYFFGKSAHTNDDWIRYVQWQLLDAVSSKRMQLLSPAVSHEKSHTTWTALVLVICICVCVQNIVAAATIWGQCLVCSELQIVQLLLKGGIYSKKYSIHFFFPQNLYLLQYDHNDPSYSQLFMCSHAEHDM